MKINQIFFAEVWEKVAETDRSVSGFACRWDWKDI